MSDQVFTMEESGYRCVLCKSWMISQDDRLVVSGGKNYLVHGDPALCIEELLKEEKP